MTALSRTISNPFEDDLDTALDQYVPADAIDAETGEFVVDNMEKAVWAADKLRRAADAIAERNAAAEKRKALIDAWLADANAADEHAVGYFEQLLAYYMQAVNEADPKRKSVKLPGVTVAARKRPDAWTFDDDAFVAWALDGSAPDLVRTKHEVDKAAAKRDLVAADGVAVLPATGEAVPGVTITPGETSIAVKLVDA